MCLVYDINCVVGDIVARKLLRSIKRTHNGTRIDDDGIGEIRKSLESRRLEKERDVTSRYVLVIPY